MNLHEYADVGTHWIALPCEYNETVYFGSFGVDRFGVEQENIKTNILEYSQTIQ